MPPAAKTKAAKPKAAIPKPAKASAAKTKAAKPKAAIPKPARASADKPFLRFTHAKPLRVRTLQVLDAIDTDDDPLPHRDALGKLIVELSNAGLNFFFIESVGKLKMGFIVNQTASLGIGSVMRVLGPTVRNIVGRMDKKQLRQVSGIMRQMMV